MRWLIEVSTYDGDRWTQFAFAGVEEYVVHATAARDAVTMALLKHGKAFPAGHPVVISALPWPDGQPMPKHPADK